MVGDAGDFEIEGANCKIGRLCGSGNEGEERVGWGVVFSGEFRAMSVILE